jgi:hypothetical protein
MSVLHFRSYSYEIGYKGPRYWVIIELTLHTTQVRKFLQLQSLGTIHEIGEIEIGNVISDDEVSIDFFEKVPPFLEHVSFFVKREDLGANDVRALFKSENITDEWFRIACKEHMRIL